MRHINNFSDYISESLTSEIRYKVQYQQYLDFISTRVSEVFTKKEYDEVCDILEKIGDPLRNFREDNTLSPIIKYGYSPVVDRNPTPYSPLKNSCVSLEVRKFQDDWYTICYSPRFQYRSTYICDQFDELIDCLVMIKNKEDVIINEAFK